MKAQDFVANGLWAESINFLANLSQKDYDEDILRDFGEYPATFEDAVLKYCRYRWQCLQGSDALKWREKYLRTIPVQRRRARHLKA